MPKLKRSSGAKKRFRVTSSNKIKRRKAFRSHILTKKSTKRKRHLRKFALVDHTNQKHIEQLLISA
jgi:large subunit ribosomal protein L35